MRTKETVFGVVVLGLVLTGMFWARTARTPVQDASADVGAHHREAATSPASADDVTFEDRTVDTGDARITLSIAPRPALAFTPFKATVFVESHGTPLALENGRLFFEMTMPMGDQEYLLVPAKNGWEADVVLPMCLSGDSRWYVTIKGTADGLPIEARFSLDLVRSTAAARP